MKSRFLLFLLLICVGCKHDRKVNTAFYYWKTTYKSGKIDSAYIRTLHTRSLYMRIMDVDADALTREPVPVSPIIFGQPLPDSLNAVPVVFIVNNALRELTKAQLANLANKITIFVDAKIKQAGKSNYSELQIDCDWTVTTRNNYFYLLNQLAIQPSLNGKKLSATLRLHQLKNLKTNGIPPVDRVMLMCYNMGNLRKYGNQNSILDIEELKKYAGSNVAQYPLPLDVGFPLFSWAVVFRDKQYAGLSKKIKFAQLKHQNHFIFIGNNMYRAVANLPEYGLLKNDEVRWEDAGISDLKTLAGYLSPLLKQDTLNLIYFHLDENVIKTYTPQQLQETADILR